MKLHTKKNIQEQGSLTAEAAIVLPALGCCLMILFSLFQYIAARNCMMRTLYGTADFLGRYALLYHENGVRQLKEELLGELDTALQCFADEKSKNASLYQKIDWRSLADFGDDLLYRQAAERIFCNILKEDPFYHCGFVVLKGISFQGSEFFNGNEDITLTAEMQPVLFLPEALADHFRIRLSIRCRGWLLGEADGYTGSVKSRVSVWSLNNFARGLAIRETFGGTLPATYPVIASFSDGTATMIKSLDHTAATYRTGTAMERELYHMADTLAAFHDTEDAWHGDPALVIRKGEVQKRKLLLVIPENTPEEKQRQVLMRFSSYCAVKNIAFELIPYQRAQSNPPVG